eukprot:scaffold91943_cov37-Prasinocladus_malaysianus.AAC.1
MFPTKTYDPYNVLRMNTVSRWQVEFSKSFVVIIAQGVEFSVIEPSLSSSEIVIKPKTESSVTTL